MVSVLKKPVVDRDRVVILEENGSADIATVYDVDDQAIYASSATQEYAIPIGNTRPYISGSGRVYVVAAESDYIRETERLAQLEKSIVLRHITHYVAPEADKNGIKLKEILLYSLIGVLLLAVVFK